MNEGHKDGMYCRLRVAMCLAALASMLLRGQIPTGMIAGVVRDSSGAALAGAAIAVKSPDTNNIREISTDASGSFKLSNLPPGTYEVTVSKEGFRPLRERNVQV